MRDATAWDRAADLLGLIKAATILTTDLRSDADAQHALAAVLNVAEMLAKQACDEAEVAERRMVA